MFTVSYCHKTLQKWIKAEYYKKGEPIAFKFEDKEAAQKFGSVLLLSFEATIGTLPGTYLLKIEKENELE